MPSSTTSSTTPTRKKNNNTKNLSRSNSSNSGSKNNTPTRKATTTTTATAAVPPTTIGIVIGNDAIVEEGNENEQEEEEEEDEQNDDDNNKKEDEKAEQQPKLTEGANGETEQQQQQNETAAPTTPECTTGTNEQEQVEVEELDWSIIVEDVVPTTRGQSFFNKNKTPGGSKVKTRNTAGGTVRIQELGGIVKQYSLIQPGDYIRLINGTTIGPSYNAERVTEYMNSCYHQRDGYLHVQVWNPMGQDSLVQATVMKPKHPDRPDMYLQYSEMGMIVWYWGVLCIKQIDDNSIWSKTVLKENDHIISVNDILCDNMKEWSFEHIINELPNELTILVRRGKQRWLGGFN